MATIILIWRWDFIFLVSESDQIIYSNYWKVYYCISYWYLHYFKRLYCWLFERSSLEVQLDLPQHVAVAHWHRRLTLRLRAKIFSSQFGGNEEKSPNLWQNFHSQHKKLSPARNDVLEAEGWSAPCAEVASFQEVPWGKDDRMLPENNHQLTWICLEFAQFKDV